jgi:hypothetical protein
MKVGFNLKKIIYSSVFLAAFPAILIMLFIPPLGTRSRLLVEPVDKDWSNNVYEDLEKGILIFILS